MGDMEQYEINALRRDAQLDWYYDWLQGFEYKNEPRGSLVSWLRFTWDCVSCGHDVEITKRGDNSYEGDCEHVFDREGVDLDRAENAQHRAYEDAMDRQYMRDCPIHLVLVSIVDWHRNHRTGQDTEVLACKCELTSPPERKKCSMCPRLSDGSHRAPRVVECFVTDEHRDPTTAYKLECGHSTIDF